MYDERIGKQMDTSLVLLTPMNAAHVNRSRADKKNEAKAAI